MHARRVRVRRLRIGLAVFAGLTLVATGVLGGVATALSWDGLFAPGPAWDDGYTITSFDTAATLNDDGTLAVTEDIEVEWHDPRRGLIREIDRSAPGGEMSVGHIDVASDTQDDVWFEVRVDEPAGHDSVHLGEEEDHRPLGTDHYRITYVLDGALAAVDGTPTLRWDTFGDQWGTMIERATVTLELPEGDHRLGCVVGAYGQAFACDGDGPSWSATELRPGRGMTVEAQLDPEAVDVDGLPTADLDPLEEFSTVALRRIGMIAALSIAAVLPLLGTVGSPSTRRRRQEAAQRIETTGVAYAPPRGLSPLTAAYLVAGDTTGVGDDRLFAAWLLDAQQRGLIEVEPQGKGFRVRAAGGGQPGSPQEAEALRALVPDPDGWVTWDSKTPAKRAGEFEKKWRELSSHHAEQAGVSAFSVARVGPGGLLLLLAAAIAAGLVATINVGGSIAILVGLLGAWGASTYTDWTLRTSIADIGGDRLELWRELEGLRRFVAEAHADQISGLADDPTVPIDSPFLELLPWVIAFGHGEQWADRFDAEIRSVTQQHGFYAPVRAADISQARAAAQPPSSSGSGAGGGGSSGVGSGAGGGGGGSR